MAHEDVRERLILYLDGDLPEGVAKEIAGHLSSCPECTRRRDLLQSVWEREEFRERPAPSPFLWTRLEARIREYENRSAVSKRLSWTARYVLLHPVSVAASIVALVVGIYLGTPSSPQYHHVSRSGGTSQYVANEFDLNVFDLVPRDVLGSSFLNGMKERK